MLATCAFGAGRRLKKLTSFLCYIIDMYARLVNDLVRLACIFRFALNMGMRADLLSNPKQTKGFMHSDTSETHKSCPQV